MIQTLLDDHAHMQLALNVLEVQDSGITAGENPDIDLMLNVLVYLQEYSEQVHHPIEDAIFSVLLKRETGTGKQLRELISDHTGMEVVTRDLRATLENIKDGPHVDTTALGDTIPKLVARLRRHLQYEEENIFPLVERVMTRLDWDNIRTMIPHINDPVFGKQLDDKYKRLHQALEPDISHG